LLSLVSMERHLNDGTVGLWPVLITGILHHYCRVLAPLPPTEGAA
jgi:hypothetical protein